MRKFMNTLAAVLVMLAAVGCEKNENLPDNFLKGKITLTATINNGATKTYLGEKGPDGKYPVLWSLRDAIAVINNGENFKFVCDEGFQSTNGTFVLESGSYSSSFDEAMPVMAIYPREIVTFEGPNKPITYTIPSQQTYSENSFGNGASPMWAYAENGNGVITFENLFGAIKLQLKGTQTIKSISIKGNNGEVLSGEASITTDANGIPNITMTSEEESAKSVLLDCKQGDVQLYDSEATAFIIALPPVTFTKGFTVTVTDMEDNEYKINSAKSNTIVKSTILTMPELTLIGSLALPWESMTILPGTYNLKTKTDFADATGLGLVWSSSDHTVVEVDENGIITAKSTGTARISVESALFGFSDECEVTVKTNGTQEPTDYIADGENYGKGIVIGNVVWAPVNCGYEPANGDNKGYPYGKLYQWGRKDGQGYSEVFDASTPIVDQSNPVPVNPDANTFYTNWTATEWSAGNNPCPAGWRVPTSEELSSLILNRSSWTQDSNGHWGYYFSGEYTHIEEAPQIFLPAAGYNSSSYVPKDRDFTGEYWSSTTDSGDIMSYRLIIDDNTHPYADLMLGTRARGCSVRCVQE